MLAGDLNLPEIPFNLLPNVRARSKWPVKMFHNLTPQYEGPKLTPRILGSFSRSPFFFLNLIAFSTHKLVDRLQPRRKLSRKLAYTVFPSANALKVAVFRRLNRQKSKIFRRTSLFNLGMRRFNAKKHRTLLRPNNRLSLPNAATMYTAGLYNGGAGWLGSFLFRTTAFRPYKGPRVRRVRFKPGYGRI